MDDGDPLTTALGMQFNGNGNKSYFPGARLYADDRSDLNDMLNQTPETSYLGKNPTPTPAPSPTPTKPSNMNLAQLYDHFGVEARPPSPVQQLIPNPNETEQLRQQFGWNT